MSGPAARVSVGDSVDVGLLPQAVHVLARAAQEVDTRLLIGGGWLRDMLRGVVQDDLDGILLGSSDHAALFRALERHATIERDRYALRVLHASDGPFHVSLLLPDEGWTATDEVEAMARGCDITVNAIFVDPLTGVLFDPLDGRADLARGVLRAANACCIRTDRLRILRVARLTATLEMEPDPALKALCRDHGFERIPAQRQFRQWQKILLDARQPSRALHFLAEVGTLGLVWPELAALRGVGDDQDSSRDVDSWMRMLWLVDAVAAARTGDRVSDEVVAFASLCHGLGATATPAFLEGIGAPESLVDQVVPLITRSTDVGLGVEALAGALRTVFRV